MKNKETLKFKMLSAALLLSFIVGIICGVPAVSATEGEALPVESYGGSRLYSSISATNGTTASVGSCDLFEEALMLNVSVAGNDPNVTFVPDKALSADDYKYIAITVRTNADIDKNKSKFVIYTATDAAPDWGEGHTQIMDYIVSDVWQTLVFDMSGVFGWSGQIKNLRLDYLQGGNYGVSDTVQIGDISFLPTKADAHELVGRITDMASDRAMSLSSPVELMNDFSEEDMQYFGVGGLNNTTVSLSDGKIVFTAPPQGGKDPYVGFDYKNYILSKGKDQKDASEVGNIVIRYSIPDFSRIQDSNGQIFYYAGSQGAAVGGREVHFELSPYTGYSVANVVVAGMPGWEGAINGMRIDWCSYTYGDAQFIIDSIAFYKNAEEANKYVEAISIYFGANYGDMSFLDPENPDLTEPDIDDPFEEETESETETETVTEEELPTFAEETTLPEESSGEEETAVGEGESASDSESEITTEDESDAESAAEGEEGTEGESGTSGGDIVDPGDGDITPTPPTEEPVQKSKMPFYVASISMSIMTLAAIVLIAVLKIKDLIAAKKV